MSVFGLLFWWRMRYFAVATFRLLARRWQATLFLLLMASPAMMPLVAQLQMLGKPVLSMLEPGHFQRSACLWTLALGVAWSWSSLQADALSGGESWQYLSLPLAPRLIQKVDLAVLLVTDLPILLPICAAEVALLHKGDMLAIPVAVAVAALAVQLPVIQLLALKRLPSIGYCLVTDFVGLRAVADGESPWLLVVAVVVGCLLGLAFPTPVRRRNAHRLINPPSCLRLYAEHSRARNVAAINLRYLFGTAQFSRYLGLLFYVSLSLVLHKLLLQDTGMNPTAAILILSLVLMPLVLRVSDLAFDLQCLHAPMAQLYTVFGLSESWVRRMNLLVLQSTFVVFCLPLTATLYLHTQSWRALGVLPIGMLTLAVCIQLNYRNANHALVPKFILTALACGGLTQWLAP